MTNIEIITTWVERFNDRDVAGCAELYAEDASLHVAFAPPVEGRAAIRAMFEAYFEAAPMHCVIERIYAGEGERVVLEWQDKVGLLGVNIYDVEAGRIRRQRNYFDQLSFLRLNGIPLPTE